MLTCTLHVCLIAPVAATTSITLSSNKIQILVENIFFFRIVLMLWQGTALQMVISQPLNDECTTLKCIFHAVHLMITTVAIFPTTGLHRHLPHEERV